MVRLESQRRGAVRKGPLRLATAWLGKGANAQKRET